ncbi:MAG TPA: UDP-N-acetylmuramoyl-L-alanine--D-glutamate ligase, partial [Fimbriimonas sp.]|nr:UDP-N-acetylmuramoyl-L-alanine--D-glutamate ligase [Fimbriimonas sp.]
EGDAGSRDVCIDSASAFSFGSHLGRSTMKGKSIAILGLGRSGLAIGLAALELGASPVVFDEKPEDQLAKRDVLEEALALGLPVVLGYRPEGDWFGSPDFVVTNPAVPKWHVGLADAIRRGIEVISEIEFAYRISKAPIVAITGTNGKSTTTVMTYLCLRACGVDAVLCGNIFGSGYPEAPLTEAALNSTPEQVLVAEISSFQLEWVNTFRPAVAAVTNITPDHLDRYSSFEEYAATKLRIFGYQTFREWAVAAMPIQVPGHEVQLANNSRELDDRIEVFGQSLYKSELDFTETHNFTNARMAAMIAVLALNYRGADPGNVNIDRVFDGLRSFKGLAHRMERLGSRGGVEVINNSMCTNPAAVVTSSQGLRKAHLLVGGVNKDLDFAPLREYLESSPHEAYIFGSDSHDLNKMLGGNLTTYRTMQEAFKAATEQAKPGETIMLAPGCASTDQFRDFRHRGDVFKAIAMEWLQS